MHKSIFRDLLILVLMICSACQKDEQNFTYEKLNEVSITTTATSFVLTQLDSLKINPQITETIPSEEGLSYEWIVYLQGADDKASLLSVDKNLKSKINLAPGNYSIRYKVTSKKTGVSSFQLYSLIVNGAFYQGWMVSNNKDGQAKLSFIRTDDVLFLSPAENINNKTYPGKVIASYSAIDRNIALTLLFTDQGIYRFNANDFIENGTASSIFSERKAVVSTAAYGLNKGAYDQYIVMDGGLYGGIGPAFYPAQVLTPFSERFTGDYSLFPAIISSSSNSTYFYDNKNKRFMQSEFFGRSIWPAAATSESQHSFNMADVGMTMIACDYGVQSVFFDDELYFVMQNNAGARYLYSLEGDLPGINQFINNSPDINIANAFATSSVTKQLYYSAGNKIYLYDITANLSRLIYSFPADVLIKDIKMLRSTSKRIVVAVNKGAVGEVFYFDLSNVGDFVGNTYVKKFEGFGEIVQLSYRK